MWKCGNAKPQLNEDLFMSKTSTLHCLPSKPFLTTRQETTQMPISIHFDRAKDTHSMDHTGLRVEHIIYARGKDIHTIILQMIHTHSS